MFSKNSKLVLLIVFLFIQQNSFSQNNTSDSLWKPFLSFIGEWRGSGKGFSGEGQYERSYRFIFNKKFIEVKNKTVYPPSKNNPKGEIHEDVGYISYDKIRNTFVLRQFHIEGFVNHYIIDSISIENNKISFISEAIENIKPGWRAKEKYEIVNDDEISETFELAPPNKEFDIYSTVVLKRIK